MHDESGITQEKLADIDAGAADGGIIQFFDVDYDTSDTELFPAKVQDVLKMINRKIAAHESLDKLMSFLFDVTREICGFDRLWLAFVHEQGQRAVGQWVKTTYQPVLLDKGYTFDILHGHMKTVIERRQVCVIQDLKAYVKQQPGFPVARLLVDEGIRSTMIAPLMMGGEVEALLFRSSRRKRVFSETSVRQHLFTAERLSQAIDHAYKRDELAQANRSYLEMLGFISHEIKSPLSSIIMESRLLAEGYLGKLQAEQQKRLYRIVGKAEYLTGLIREFLDLARIENSDLELRLSKKVEFALDVIDPAVELLKHHIEGKQMQLEFVKPFNALVVDVDRTLMRIVIVNLLGNAVKYGFTGGKIKLTAELTATDLRVSVWNEGIGFQRQDQAKLFKKFSRLTPAKNANESGTGIGLYTCWRIIRMHGGSISADSEYRQWAEFSFSVPQPPQPGKHRYTSH
jgi:signal transduction histidine kinase